jgi:hypothetical protein
MRSGHDQPVDGSPPTVPSRNDRADERTLVFRQQHRARVVHQEPANIFGRVGLRGLRSGFDPEGEDCGDVGDLGDSKCGHHRYRVLTPTAAANSASFAVRCSLPCGRGDRCDRAQWWIELGQDVDRPKSPGHSSASLAHLGSGQPARGDAVIVGDGSGFGRRGGSGCGRTCGDGGFRGIADHVRSRGQRHTRPGFRSARTGVVPGIGGYGSGGRQGHHRRGLPKWRGFAVQVAY